jgi:polysaccharide export outer membrane protein
MEVAVVGAVAKPGRFSLLGERSLIDVLAEAGGLTEKAGSIAYVIRYDKTTSGSMRDSPTTVASSNAPPFASRARSIRIDLDGLLLRGEQHWNILLQSGDLVNVPEAGWVHVTGPGVKKPGTYPLTRSTKTLRQILDEAGGVRFEVSRTMQLLRKSEDGSANVITLDYRSIVRDESSDVVLRAGDTIVTERTLVKGVLATIGRGLESIAHFGVYGTYSVPL